MNKDQLAQSRKPWSRPAKAFWRPMKARARSRGFDAIGVESTAETRRDYRELLFRTAPAMERHISGVILYDETHPPESGQDGTPLVS